MTLTELESTLPNGLHDAELLGLSFNYGERLAVVQLNIDVSDSTSEPPLEAHRQADVVFSGLQFAVVDPPGQVEPWSRLSIIDSGEGQPQTSRLELPAIRDGCFLCWIFAVEWNGFIRISAESVTLRWLGPVF